MRWCGAVAKSGLSVAIIFECKEGNEGKRESEKTVKEGKRERRERVERSRDHCTCLAAHGWLPIQQMVVILWLYAPTHGR